MKIVMYSNLCVSTFELEMNQFCLKVFVFWVDRNFTDISVVCIALLCRNAGLSPPSQVVPLHHTKVKKI